MMSSKKSLLLPLLFLSACAANPPQQTLTVSGTLIEENGKFFLQAEEERYHLNRMPQLRYQNYLGQQLLIKGEVPNNCQQVWKDSIVQVQGGAEIVDMNKVDWSECLVADKVSLVTADGPKLVYDWEQIDLQDYYF
ncbi:hypothetical protein M0G74_03315 [Microbulbifer sp. CAU 1566]|uniref:hypothetical protein n=1 Tax=unclassified Microbulbifer TaxID=2619833 RepID=UPI001358ECAA|nr:MULTISPECIES: hypothetical protein [unclassified Microbulbifer]MCK7596296.1 hypothetical protein [Microbulbifer sp. CAU 1566]